MLQANTSSSYQQLQKSPAHESGQQLNVTETLLLLSLEPQRPHIRTGLRHRAATGIVSTAWSLRVGGRAPGTPAPSAPGRGPFVRGTAAAAPLRRYGRRPPPPHNPGDPHPPPTATGGRNPPRLHRPLHAVPRAREGCGRRSPRSTPVTFREWPPGPPAGGSARRPPVPTPRGGAGRRTPPAGGGGAAAAPRQQSPGGAKRRARSRRKPLPARQLLPTPESYPDAGGAGSLRSSRPQSRQPRWRRRPPGPARAPPAHLRRRCRRPALRCPPEERTERGGAREVRPWHRPRAHGRQRARPGAEGGPGRGGAGSAAAGAAASSPAEAPPPSLRGRGAVSPAEVGRRRAGQG